MRLPGDPGRHVWLSDDALTMASSSTVSWRDHREDCACCYCTVDEPVAARP